MLEILISTKNGKIFLFHSQISMLAVSSLMGLLKCLGPPIHCQDVYMLLISNHMLIFPCEPVPSSGPLKSIISHLTKMLA